MFSFNSEEEKKFDPVLEEGIYPVTVAEAEYKPSKSNPSNYMVSLVFAINEGERSGWKIYKNFNVVNSNDIAQKIGRSELKEFCEACGVISFDDVDELKGAALSVQTKNKVYQGRTSAEIVKFMPEGDSEVEIPFA